MLHLIATAEHTRVAWLPQFVEHYRELGVERFHLSLHVEPGTARDAAARAVRSAEEILGGMGIALFAVVICPFDSDAFRAWHDEAQAQRTAPGDWIVWADSDEFQIYPAPLPEMIRRAEREGYDFFRGIMIDRVAADGALVDFDASRPVWEQYPRRCRLTRDVALACDIKTPCARAEIVMLGGNHGPEDETGWTECPDWAEIHHFKWDSTVVRRLRRRLEPDWKERCFWWTESARLLDHIERHGGRIDTAALERACAERAG